MVTRVSQNCPPMNMADSFDEKLMNIYILLGKDFYHTYVAQEIISGKSVVKFQFRMNFNFKVQPC